MGGKLCAARWRAAIGTHSFIESLPWVWRKGKERRTGTVLYLVEFMSPQLFLVPVLPMEVGPDQTSYKGG